MGARRGPRRARGAARREERLERARRRLGRASSSLPSWNLREGMHFYPARPRRTRSPPGPRSVDVLAFPASLLVTHARYVSLTCEKYLLPRTRARASAAWGSR